MGIESVYAPNTPFSALIPPGPVVGEAYRFLLDLRLELGPLDEKQATQALLAWWAARPGP